MIKKPDKLTSEVTSYCLMSLLSAISKVFEKLILKAWNYWLTFLDTYQFGFLNQHLMTDQIHRVKSLIENTLEEKKYCLAVFNEISQHSIVSGMHVYSSSLANIHHIIFVYWLNLTWLVIHSVWFVKKQAPASTKFH